MELIILVRGDWLDHKVHSFFINKVHPLFIEKSVYNEQGKKEKGKKRDFIIEKDEV
jgi:hypothetical protein